MKKVMGGLAALVVLVVASPVAAQQPAEQRPADPVRETRTVEQAIDSSGIVPAVEALAVVATPELERALGQLAQSLAVIATRIAGDPELRASAARAGSGIAQVAEAAVVEHTSTLQQALRALADRLDELAVESAAKESDAKNDSDAKNESAASPTGAPKND